MKFKIHHEFDAFARVVFCSDLHLGQTKAAWYRGWYDGLPKFGMPKPMQRERLEKLPVEQLQAVSSQHDQTILWCLRELELTKDDCLICLGDVAFTSQALDAFSEAAAPSKLLLIRGNNDLLPLREYLRAFDDVLGYWEMEMPMPILLDKAPVHCVVSHCPIHPNETRGRMNLHGHVHADSILPLRNPSYINLTWEGLQQYHDNGLLPWARELSPTKYSKFPVSPFLNHQQLQMMLKTFRQPTLNSEPRKFPA
jgi:calcineurin-like phosphoesterase family protein